MRLKVVLFLYLIMMLQANAQHYTRDIGLRGGAFPGISYRQYTSDLNYAEVLVNLQSHAIRVTFLREFVRPAFHEFSERMFFVYGYGAHSGFSNADKYRLLNRTYFYNNPIFSPVFGIDGYLSIEYRFTKAPFVASVDIKPFFEYSMNQFFNLVLYDTALNLKFKF